MAVYVFLYPQRTSPFSKLKKTSFLFIHCTWLFIFNKSLSSLYAEFLLSPSISSILLFSLSYLPSEGLVFYFGLDSQLLQLPLFLICLTWLFPVSFLRTPHCLSVFSFLALTLLPVQSQAHSRTHCSPHLHTIHSLTQPYTFTKDLFAILKPRFLFGCFFLLQIFLDHVCVWTTQQDLDMAISI